MSGSTQAAGRRVPLWVWIVGVGVIVSQLSTLSGGESDDDVTGSQVAQESEVVETPSDAEEDAQSEEPEPEPEQAREPFPDIVYYGSGDSVLRIELPAGPDSIGVASISHTGSGFFAVWALDEDLEQNGLLVNTVGNYTGTVAIDSFTRVRIAAFEIKADGPWKVTMRDVLTLQEIEQGSSVSGEGSDTLIYNGKTTIASISHQGQNNFAIWSFGEQSDLLVNEIGNYNGQVRWQSGPALIQISADGAWSIDLE